MNLNDSGVNNSVSVVLNLGGLKKNVVLLSEFFNIFSSYFFALQRILWNIIRYIFALNVIKGKKLKRVNLKRPKKNFIVNF